MTQQAVPLLLVIFIGLASYAAIFLSLQSICSRNSGLKEENRAGTGAADYLHLAADIYATAALLDGGGGGVQNSRAAHDRRHFNNMLLELLEQGNGAAAMALLKKQNQAMPKMSRIYCENPAVNAAVSHYAAMAEQVGIQTEIELDIPSDTEVDSLELSMAVSNLMENAIQACATLEDAPFLRFTCRRIGRLLLEMENPCQDGTVLDESGYPVSGEEGHGNRQ